MHVPRRFWGYVTGFLLWISAALPASVWACTVCWGGSAKQGWAFAVSSYVLLGTPFLILGSIIGGVSLLQKRAQRQRQQSRPPDTEQPAPVLPD